MNIISDKQKPPRVQHCMMFSAMFRSCSETAPVTLRTFHKPPEACRTAFRQNEKSQCIIYCILFFSSLLSFLDRLPKPFGSDSATAFQVHSVYDLVNWILSWQLMYLGVKHASQDYKSEFTRPFHSNKSNVKFGALFIAHRLPTLKMPLFSGVLWACKVS